LEHPQFTSSDTQRNNRENRAQIKPLTAVRVFPHKGYPHNFVTARSVTISEYWLEVIKRSCNKT